jgi:heme-degrading monooxygenase HmoA
MFAVVFEVQPRAERWHDYLELAQQLKPRLERIEGFLDNERFESKRRVGRVLSLSIWRDEKSVIRWRTHGEHHLVQEKGRFDIFRDYHLRVGEITFDNKLSSGGGIEQYRFDNTEVGAAKTLSITEFTLAHGEVLGLEPDQLANRIGLPDDKALLDHEVFESIANREKLLLLASWANDKAARAFRPNAFSVGTELRHRRIRVIRDYGMFDRREAPQYYPDVPAGDAQGA